MTSILLESKDQLLINPSFTFFPPAGRELATVKVCVFLIVV